MNVEQRLQKYFTTFPPLIDNVKATVARERFLSNWEGAENIKYKFYFASKLPSMCINL